jgi:hypothetical protein
MRASAEARWMSFTSEQTLETCRSGFRWEARTSGMRVAHRLEVWWRIPSAPFCYYRSEVTRCEGAG